VIERREKRRRLREQRRVREALLLDLGALVYELHRQGKRAPELLQRKAAQLTVVDQEVRRLQAELEGVEAEETAEVDAVSDEGELPDEDSYQAQADDAEWHETQSEDDELDDHEPEEDDELEQATDEHEPAVPEHEEPLR
jgi:hypothetical protein